MAEYIAYTEHVMHYKEKVKEEIIMPHVQITVNSSGYAQRHLSVETGLRIPSYEHHIVYNNVNSINIRIM